MTKSICCTLPLALLGMIIVHLPIVQAENEKRPLETTVKVLRATTASAPAVSMRAVRRPAPTPTTPGAKYPQYQLAHPQTSNSHIAHATDARLRFFLHLPNQSLLIEAMIKVDQLAFPMARRQRVEQILREVIVGKDIPLPAAPIADQKVTDVAVQPASADPVVMPTSDGRVPTAPEPVAVADRIRHTMNLTGEKPTVDEIDWMISNWIDGPVIMQLNDNFQRFRANQRPEFVILDRNRDGTVSAEEMQQAVQSFQECDLNQDGLIQFTEIAVAAIEARSSGLNVENGNLITLLPDAMSASIAFQRLADARSMGKDGSNVSAIRFDANANGQFEAEELQAMRDAAPDLQLSIAFDTTNPEKSRVALIGVAADFQTSFDQAKVDSTGITLMIGDTPVIFAAVQGPAGDQISIGAVNDGYPFLPSLDTNDDGRLTIRECRTLVKTLNNFDTNHDGALSAEESRSPFRVCIGLGPIVHRELAGIRSIHRKSTTSPTMGPEWFVRMDRNKDNDLTRGEFPGADEQFRDLDADGDELISAEEALDFDKKAGRLPQTDDVPAANQATDSNSNKDETKP